MSRTKAIILMAFVLALGAGVAVGMLGSRALPPAATGRARFVQELQLTPQQQKEIDTIWMDLMSKGLRAGGEEFRSIQQQRESAVMSLLTPEQKSQYEAINQRSFQQMQDVMKRGQQDFEAAAEKTRKVLDENQRKKFDELISRFQAPMSKPGGEGWWGMPMMMPPTTAPH